MREWRHASTGARYREILTAKPGQRPCRWVSWDEMRKWLVQWHGYCIFKYEMVPDPSAPKPTAAWPTDSEGQRQLMQQQRELLAKRRKAMAEAEALAAAPAPGIL